MIHSRLRAAFTALDHKVKAVLAIACIVFVSVSLHYSVPTGAFFTSGSSAVDVLGQFEEDLVTPFLNKGGANDGPNRRGVALPAGMAMDFSGHRLFVADQHNGRVLVYNLNNDNTLPDRLPDYVLGQADFITPRDISAPSQSRLVAPEGIFYDADNSRLFVADSLCSRVMVFDIADGITNGEPAVAILGTTDYDFCFYDTSDTGLAAPSGVLYENTHQRLFVSDKENNRVTVFNLADGITDGEAAIHVLGQTDFFSSGAATTQTGMSAPKGLAYDSGLEMLYVGEAGNYRVTAWDVNSITDGEPAVAVLGKPDFTTLPGAPSITALGEVGGIALDSAGKRLFVAQLDIGDRVSVFDVNAITNGEAAVAVLGKPNHSFATTGLPSQTNMNPFWVFFDSSAFNRGFISGYLNEDGTSKNLFGVTNSITRAEAAKVIVKVFGL